MAETVVLQILEALYQRLAIDTTQFLVSTVCFSLTNFFSYSYIVVLSHLSSKIITALPPDAL